MLHWQSIQECLNGLNDEMIEAEDYILTPYYIFMGKRMELYEYELTIVADKEQSFEEYLLDITGKQSISDIPGSIIERRKNCYIECEKNTQMMNVGGLRRYINFLLFNDDLQCQIKGCYGFFSTDNMFFTNNEKRIMEKLFLSINNNANQAYILTYSNGDVVEAEVDTCYETDNGLAEDDPNYEEYHACAMKIVKIIVNKNKNLKEVI